MADSNMFYFRDSGIGIAQSDKDQLFMPFQQADNSSTRKFGYVPYLLEITHLTWMD